jgi:site-specific recombinase XerD
MTPVLEHIDRVFEIESFRDYLALEAGNSANTVEAYARDIRRLAEFATSKGATEPAQVTRTLLRDFVFLLTDLGLSPAPTRR